MGLIDRLLGRTPAAASSGLASLQFRESETTPEKGSTNARRRDLLQVVLRDTVRRHGIPSDWIDLRVLSVDSRKAQPSAHAQFIVRSGGDRLMPFAYTFQDSFMAALQRFEPKARDWLLSLSWQLEDPDTAHPAMPDPAAWEPARAAQPADSAEDDVTSDIAALFAIRDAALLRDPRTPDSKDGQVDFQNTQPGEPPRSAVEQSGAPQTRS